MDLTHKEAMGLFRKALRATSALLLLIACAGPADGKPKIPKRQTMNTAPVSEVAPLLGLRDQSRKDVLARLQNPTVDEDRAYERLKGVAHVANTAVHPGHFYFRGDKLVMVYISDHKFLSHLSLAAVEKELGKPAKDLRSRAGKTARQYVWPEKGFALSVDGDAVDFIEAFPATTLQVYLDTIYEDPGAFTK